VQQIAFFFNKIKAKKQIIDLQGDRIHATQRRLKAAPARPVTSQEQRFTVRCFKRRYALG
jgi:hypothetical protein